MKYLILLTISLVCAFKASAQMPNSGSNQIELPDKILDYLKTSFPEYKILKYETEKEGSKSSFEVYLDHLIVLDFDEENNIEGIDGKAKLPDSAIHPKILEYVNAKYVGSSIVDWELENRIQEVTLDNGYELKFNKEGEFLTVKKSD